tara:strand:+ start:186 stop:788 length:603 start_codon:yes stop_codon:yes gene_type:complete
MRDFKKSILATTLALIVGYMPAVAQNKKTKLLLAEIAGSWQLDASNAVTYQLIADVPGATAAQLYDRSLDYLGKNYTKADHSITTQDPDRQQLAGRGIFAGIHRGSLPEINLDTWHTIRIDTKENRARITITIAEYFRDQDLGLGREVGDIPIASQYPINEKGMYKNQYGRAFVASHQAATQRLQAVADYLTSSPTSKDW